MAWDFYRTSRFKKGYKRAASSDLQERIDKAILQMAGSDDPRKLGQLKTGPFSGYYAYEFGQACRLLYRVLLEDRIINLERVCGHKEYMP